MSWNNLTEGEKAKVVQGLKASAASAGVPLPEGQPITLAAGGDELVVPAEALA